MSLCGSDPSDYDLYNTYKPSSFSSDKGLAQKAPLFYCLNAFKVLKSKYDATNSVFNG